MSSFRSGNQSTYTGRTTRRLPPACRNCRRKRVKVRMYIASETLGTNPKLIQQNTSVKQAKTPLPVHANGATARDIRANIASLQTRTRCHPPPRQVTQDSQQLPQSLLILMLVLASRLCVRGFPVPPQHVHVCYPADITRPSTLALIGDLLHPIPNPYTTPLS
jgi:hypothetical protein